MLTGEANEGLVYVIGFHVLGLCWLGAVRTAMRGEQVSEEHARWALSYLLLITFVPFATMVAGRYPSLAPAVWLYAATMILLALVAFRMLKLAAHGKEVTLDAQIGLGMLIVAAALTILLSLIVPKGALLAYLVNLLDGPARWGLRGREAR